MKDIQEIREERTFQAKGIMHRLHIGKADQSFPHTVKNVVTRGLGRSGRKTKTAKVGPRPGTAFCVLRDFRT